MIRKKENRYRLQFLYRPGLTANQVWLTDLVKNLRDTANTCFDEIPPYQAMVGTREELSDKVLSVAWHPDGEMAGFCSTVLLPVKHVGEILHLGLTCVRPEDRGSGLTHLLTKKAVASYLVRHKPIGRLWISNCAAVLSSLGNVALHFENVYPSPMVHVKPKKNHYRIALAIERYYRKKIYIHDNAEFDETKFVFRGSVKDTVFQKAEDDKRYHHRNGFLNNYYSRLMDFDNGDEVLQIGYVSTLSTVKYTYRRRNPRKQAVRTMDLAA
jgi:hypothetical protein